MRVLKFGGTSVSTPERIRDVTAIVSRALVDEGIVVVTSAFAGVTNALIAASVDAVAGGAGWRPALEAMEKRHLGAIDAVAAAGEAPSLRGGVFDAISELKDLLHGASLVRECSPRTMDSVMSYGERLAAPILAAALRGAGLGARSVDARDVVVTDQTFGGARVLFEETNARIAARIAALGNEIAVVTGFIGATASGETTTLGRGGSDYTAAVLGAALGASVIEIWTDVDGVMSADPRVVPSAFSIEAMTYDELMELSHFGAKVVYPPTVHPAREGGIPLLIKNTFNPAFAGTRVSRERSDNTFEIRGISSIPRVALLRLEGDGMVGVPGIAGRLFGALAQERINVILITQASSEHSICFAIDPAAVDRAKAKLESEFALERRAGLIDDVIVEDDAALVAVVGEGMHERTGVSARLFGTLGRRRINVRAISQGSSELNISVAISRDQEGAAIRAIHDAFFAGDVVEARIALAGRGRVGGTLLNQLSRTQASLEAVGIRLRLVGLATSRGLRFEPDGIVPGAWREPLAETVGSAAALADGLLGQGGLRVFVDCTASDEAPALYESLLRGGVAIVAANKRAFAGPMSSYVRLKVAARSAGLFAETTVGAGLPVLGTLADLVQTSDEIRRIEGCLSGTLGFLMDRLGAGTPFSAAVREAHERGYTEPDPRDDLSGVDVGRKLLILAREAGFSFEPEDVKLEPLLPGEGWWAKSLDEFWRDVAGLDEHYAELARVASATGRRLAYVGRVEPGRITASLQLVAPGHPCHSLSGTDNLVAFWTERYNQTPLVVRGPGAGPEVTAAGVYADILKAASRSTAPFLP